LSKSTKKINGSISLDLGYLNAATILAKQPVESPITIYLVGCGGTGSFMALHIGRLLRTLADNGQKARAYFIDHDRVELKNIGRQLFCDAELNMNKAEALAYRYGVAWGNDVTAIGKRFQAAIVTNTEQRGADALHVIVGCVDNAAARTEIANALVYNQGSRIPSVWWLDCGNHEDAGQVLLGTARTRRQLAGAFPSAKICQSLPAPSLQRPELLKPRPEETNARRLSCAELAAANLQSQNINSRIASEASDFLTRLLLTRDLKRFACELNLAAGSMRSFYATSEALEGFAN
jgi:PRTRC genetic system ThiF family protein